MRMASWHAAVTVLSVVLTVVDGHLDLFMNETETKRLLGESACYIDINVLPRLWSATL